jgi:DNA-binding response OmpR family regulator
LECYPLTRTVDNHIAKLRQKIERDPAAPEWLITVHGVGYKFVG